MENASKALIIAGSILLSILIIALGMYIFGTSSSTSDVTILSETEIQTYNAKFEKYNKEQIGSNIDALIKAIRANATANKGTHEKVPTVIFLTSGYTAGNVNGFEGVANNDIASRGLNNGSIVAGRTTGPLGTDGITTYNQRLTEMLNNIENSHRYRVSMIYDDQGLIARILISYNTNLTLNS